MVLPCNSWKLRIVDLVLLPPAINGGLPPSVRRAWIFPLSRVRVMMLGELVLPPVVEGLFVLAVAPAALVLHLFLPVLPLIVVIAQFFSVPCGVPHRLSFVR